MLRVTTTSSSISKKGWSPRQSRRCRFAEMIADLPRMLRFDKNDILRIIRALATFRPSLIALQMPLTEEDEVRLRRLTARPRPSRADSFWRATDFRRANIPTHARRTQQAHLVLGHADRSLAQDGRDLLGRDRVLPAYGLEAGRARRQEIHLRGSFLSLIHI